MISYRLEEKIVSLIPSKTIKKKVKELSFRFQEMDLVDIVIRYAPFFDERIRLLEELMKEVSSDNIYVYIYEYLKIERQDYQTLINVNSDEVYDIVFENSCNERYLAYSYEACFDIIDKYFECFKEFMSDNEDTEISIYKRRIKDDYKIKDIGENYYIEATYDKNKRLLRIYSDSECIPYELFDIKFNAICYPPVFSKYDLVSLDFKLHKLKNHFDEKEYSEGKEVYYLINSFDNTKTYDDDYEEACLLFLNDEYVRNRKIEYKDKYGVYPYLMNHIHLDYGYLEIVDITTLPDNIKNDYEYVKKTMMKIEG